MTIKLNSLDRWKELPPGQSINFDHGVEGQERRIRLHLNLADQTAFYVENKDGPRFLCVAGPGLETVEFSAFGKIAVMAEDASDSVHYQTAEDEPTFAVVVDPVIFTKIANRRHRNPELEEMMFRMNQNMERRLAQQAGEIEAAFARRQKEATDGRPAERVETVAPGAAANAGATQVPAQEPIPSEPVADPASEDDGKPAGE